MSIHTPGHRVLKIQLHLPGRKQRQMSKRLATECNRLFPHLRDSKPAVRRASSEAGNASSLLDSPASLVSTEHLGRSLADHIP